jgi:hypothetical protein
MLQVGAQQWRQLVTARIMCTMVMQDARSKLRSGEKEGSRSGEKEVSI